MHAEEVAMYGGKSRSKMSKEEKEYQAEDDCRTLLRAEEIKADKERHKAALKHAKEKAKALDKVTGD